MWGFLRVVLATIVDFDEAVKIVDVLQEEQAMRRGASGLGEMVNAVADVIRDQGHVMFCNACRRAEMPGALRCSKCGCPVGRVSKPAKKLTAVEAA